MGKILRFVSYELRTFPLDKQQPITSSALCKIFRLLPVLLKTKSTTFAKPNVNHG